MKLHQTTLLALLLAALTHASPAPSFPTSTTLLTGTATSLPAVNPTPTASTTAGGGGGGGGNSLIRDSIANPAQAAAISALLAQCPSDTPSATSSKNTTTHSPGTLIEILVTPSNKMYLRYQHTSLDPDHYREFNTSDGRPPPATGPGDEDDLGYSRIMEALYGGKEGSLGDSLQKAWGLYRSVYGGLPSGVPSSVLLSSTGTATGTAT